MIYSFYREGVEESLKDHILLALNKVSEVRSSRLARAVDDPDKLSKALKISVIAHDLGKAFYQVEHKGKMSFRGHEVISAYILNNSLIELSEWEKWHLPLVFSVLYHHHAMGFENWSSNYLKYKRRGFQAALEERNGLSLLEELSQIVEEVSPEEVKEVTKVISEKVLELSSFKSAEEFVREVNLTVDDVRKKIWENFTYGGDPVMRKRSLVLLSGLVTADYLASNESRGGDSKFLRVLREFHELYMRGL